MPRSIVLGNGKLQVNFDVNYVVRDLFFPHVGQENHFAGERCRTGFWSNGRFAWEEDPVWERQIGYLEDTLVSEVRLFHPEWGLQLVFNDTVDLDRAILFRRLTATNNAEEEQEVRAFFHYDFHIYEHEVGDTILFDPQTEAIIAYKGSRYFLANVQSPDGHGVRNWAIGVTEFQGREGTWRDAEDGHLQENPIAQGSVDGTVALPIGTLTPGASSTGYHWLAAGKTRAEVEAHDRAVRQRTPDSFIDRTRDWWRAWSRVGDIDFGDLSPEIASLYHRSLLTIRTHVDDDGAIIASTDRDIIHYSRDTYAYCWPRDAAHAILALDQAGYGELVRRFFGFCQRTLNPYDGYFLHKFTASGELGSSWHPWTSEDKDPRIPIQEDETGIVLFALWTHFERHRDIEFIKPLYRSLIRSTADFMVGFRDNDTGLPLPSYDLWEERFGVHAYTVASVWAGLDAAAKFADTFNQQKIADDYRSAANEIKVASVKHLWDSELGCFSRTLHPSGQNGYRRDSVLDASVLALSQYGMFDPRDPMILATAEAIHQRLWCQTPVGGVSRYESDSYQRVVESDGSVPGNPWFICTLWLARHYVSISECRSDLEKAKKLLRWAGKHASPSGLLAEQVNPNTGAPISVAPLTWSHAEFVTAVQHYLEAYAKLT